MLRSGVTLALALLALGCGGSSGSGQSGGAGTSGAAGTSAAGTSGAAGAPCTTGYQPCGGDVVGTWAIDHSCEPPGQVQSANSCMGETFDFTKVLSQESWTFAADRSLTLTLAASGPATIVVPDRCLQAMTPPLTCADDSIGAADVQHTTFPGGKLTSPSCNDAAGVCTCTLSVVAAPASSSGTYATAGSTLTVSAGNSSLSFDYCATETTLKLRGHNADGSFSVVLLFDKTR